MLVSAGCGDAGGDSGGEFEVPSTYAFESRMGGSSVDYAGQVFRHVLIADLAKHIGGLTARIDTGALTPEPGDVIAELDFYYRFDGDTSGGVAHGISTTPATKQSNYEDIASGKDLQGKIAGNDPVGQHRDWATAFVGWDDPAVTSPDSLVRLWFEQLDEFAVDRANGMIPAGPDGNPISEVFVTPEGLDLQQLVQKFLLGAVAFSQAADDYLDDDVDGKGLLSDHSALMEGKPYTALERAWDEGFGYFGAARDYGDYTDDEIAGKGGRDEYARGYHDSDGDGAIDLLSEYNFGHSVNAAKRDRESSVDAPTDFTGDAWTAFLTGRAIIASADGPLSEAQMNELKAQRDIALRAWESAIVATIIRYINKVLQDMAQFGTAEYRFIEHARSWSELKGFALSLQFNPRSPLSDTQFRDLHDRIGRAPVLPNRPQEDIDAYRTALLEARDILRDAYGFAAENMGDSNGEGGW